MSTDYTHFSNLAFTNLFARGPDGNETLIINSSGILVGSLSISGALSVASITVAGTTTVNGDFVLSSGSFASNLPVKTDATYDVGSASKRFASVATIGVRSGASSFVIQTGSSSATAVTVNTSQQTTFAKQVTFSSASIFTGTATINGDFAFSGGNLASNIPIKTDATYDVGSASKRFSSIGVIGVRSGTSSFVIQTGVSSTTAVTVDTSQNTTFAGTIGATNFSGSHSGTSSGTNTGDVTIGTANGLSLASQAISMAAAASATIGVVTAGSQTFGGSKTFKGVLNQTSSTQTGFTTACTGNGILATFTGNSTGGLDDQVELRGIYTNATSRPLFRIVGRNTNTTASSSGGILRTYVYNTAATAVLCLEQDRTGANRFPNITTTASAANAFLDNADSNNLLRSTSSARYKDNIKDLELDSEVLYKLRPVEFDDKTFKTHHIGLVAEEVAEVCPTLVNFTKETVLNPNGDPDKKVPDGVQYQLISVLLLQELKKLKEEINGLKSL